MVRLYTSSISTEKRKIPPWTRIILQRDLINEVVDLEIIGTRQCSTGCQPVFGAISQQQV